ncbi:hypothetical protein HWV62_26206 [Athelia sp. TMB]|nr:hypothetical protein HWV62_26206 [Athelia sp. TMB]
MPTTGHAGYSVHFYLETIKAGKKIDNKLDLVVLPGGRFLVAEAKGGSNLREWLKQIVAQVVAVHLPCILFTLTNGTHWIFGVLDTSVSTRVVHHSEPVHFLSGNPKRFMDVLFLWASLPPLTFVLAELTG